MSHTAHGAPPPPGRLLPGPAPAHGPRPPPTELIPRAIRAADAHRLVWADALGMAWVPSGMAPWLGLPEHHSDKERTRLLISNQDTGKPRGNAGREKTDSCRHPLSQPLLRGAGQSSKAGGPGLTASVTHSSPNCEHPECPSPRPVHTVALRPAWPRAESGVRRICWAPAGEEMSPSWIA